MLCVFPGGRRLLQTSELEPQGNDSFNCTLPAIKEFPSDGLTRQQRQAGFIIIHFVIAIYLFLLLAVVCDDYFVPAIKKICDSEYASLRPAESFSIRLSRVPQLRSLCFVAIIKKRHAV